MKLCVPLMIGLDHQIKKSGYIFVETKGKEVRKHFAVLDNIKKKLIFYDIIFIVKHEF